MTGLEFALAAALLGPAQAEKTATIREEKSETVLVGRSVTARRPVDEQIEVMRALLLRKLAGGGGGTYSWTYPTLTGTVYVSGKTGELGLADSSTPALTGALQGNYYRAGTHGSSVEGVYLDGYGAVFTATMDAVARDPRPKADGDKAAAAMTEWERMQKALRGEPVDKPTTTAKEPPLGDVILRLLADNGKHFTALKDDERLTVAVTFRGTPHSATLSMTGQSATTAIYGTAMGGDVKEDRAGSQESLGDLHLKQGQPQRAIEAYQKALSEARHDGKDAPEGADGRVHGAMLKLAQAYLAAGQLDKARQSMEEAAALKNKSAPQAKTTTGNKPAALPARLTVSATKRQVDDVGSGKITFDEFRKQATVEYVAAAK